MDELRDPKNIEFEVEFQEVIDNGKLTSTQKALKIIFGSMNYNFEKIIHKTDKNSHEIKELQLEQRIIVQKLNTVDELETSHDVTTKKLDTHVNSDRSDFKKIIAGVIGVGSISTILILVELWKFFAGS